ncbi:hypothetical protein HC891_12185 [Candidatus Gracilibacteria bacterium]|nr:hypothetical protein [Candidatus Gracilibacteria bacterium]
MRSLPRTLDRITHALSWCLIVALLAALCPAPAPLGAQGSGSIVRFEDSAAGWTPTGTWSSASVGVASGGTVRQSKTATSTLTFTFTGPWIHLGLRAATNAGKVNVSIDGVSREVLDTYARQGTTISRSYGDLGGGAHTLTLTVLGQRNSFASDSFVFVDYVDVWDGLAVAEGTFDQSHTRVARSTDWSSVTQSAAQGGSYLRDGANIWFPFTGSSVRVDTWADSSTGQIRIFIDGVSQGVFDLASSTAGVRTFSFDQLSAGPMSCWCRNTAGARQSTPSARRAWPPLSPRRHPTRFSALKKTIPRCGSTASASTRRRPPGRCLARIVGAAATASGRKRSIPPLRSPSLAPGGVSG